MSLLLDRRFLTPALEPETNVLWIKFQRSTDVYKRERPGVVIGEEPRLRFFNQTLDVPPSSDRLFLKTYERVFKDCAPECDLSIGSPYIRQRGPRLFHRGRGARRPSLCGRWV